MRLLFLFTLIYLFSVAAQSQTPESTVSKVRAKLDNVHDYSSKGSLKLDVEFIRIPTSKVEVYFKKPDLFKIKSSDGLSILPKGGFSVNLQTLLASNQFSVVKVGETNIAGYPVDIIKLIPLAENSDLLVATLYIDVKEYLIRKSITTSKQSGTVEMELTYGNFAQWGLPDKVNVVFSTKEYKLPKGISFDYNPNGSSTQNKKPSTGKGKVEMIYETYIVNKGISDQVFK